MLQEGVVAGVVSPWVLVAGFADVEGERERSNAGAFIIHDQRRAVPVHGLPKTFGNSDSNALRRLNFERRIPLIPS